MIQNNQQKFLKKYLGKTMFVNFMSNIDFHINASI